MQPTQVEKDIISILRELKPHERIEIIKDQSGKLDSYIVHRSQKIIIALKNTSMV